jgi:7,8-dihydroneopterin aldolase/epimerase/oxygenase
MNFINRCIRIREFSQLVSIGFYPVEKQRPQRVFIDVDLYLAPLPAAIEDDIAATVNYDSIHAQIPKLVANRHFNLQETLCHEILGLCATLKGVQKARVWVRKPDVYADCGSAGYEAAIVVSEAGS